MFYGSIVLNKRYLSIMIIFKLKVVDSCQHFCKGPL